MDVLLPKVAGSYLSLPRPCSGVTQDDLYSFTTNSVWDIVYTDRVKLVPRGNYLTNSDSFVLFNWIWNRFYCYGTTRLSLQNWQCKRGKIIILTLFLFIHFGGRSGHTTNTLNFTIFTSQWFCTNGQNHWHLLESLCHREIEDRKSHSSQEKSNNSEVQPHWSLKAKIHLPWAFMS